MKINKFHFFFALFLVVLLFSLPIGQKEAYAAKGKKTSKEKKKESNKPVKKKARLEVIHSKKKLINSYKKHILKYDKYIYYKISKKVASTEYQVEKILNSLNTSIVTKKIMENIIEMNIEEQTAAEYYYIYYDLTYSMPKEELDEVVVKYREAEKMKEISSFSKLKETYLKHFYNLDRVFKLRVKNNLLWNYENDIKKFVRGLRYDPKYTDVFEHMELSIWDDDYGSFKVYHFQIETDLTKEEVAEIVKNASPVIQTREAFKKAIVHEMKKQKEEIVLNVKKSVIDFTDKEEGKKFFKELNQDPEYKRIMKTTEQGNYHYSTFVDYFRFSIPYQYGVEKKTKIKKETKEEETPNYDVPNRDEVD